MALCDCVLAAPPILMILVTCRIERRAVRLVFMLVVMVTSLSLGGVASLISLSTGTASTSGSDTFRHSLTHLETRGIIFFSVSRKLFYHLARLSACAITASKTSLASFLSSVPTTRSVMVS